MTATTLDDYLVEVDRWKHAAQAKTKGLSGRELAAYYRRVRAAWKKKLAKLGQRSTAGKRKRRSTVGVR